MRKIMIKSGWNYFNKSIAPFIVLTFCCTNTCINSLNKNWSQESINSLHSQINNGLLNIKSIFPKSTKQVHTLLDQFSKIHTASKQLYETNTSLKQQINDNQNRIKNLTDENNDLKEELETTKQKFEITFKELEEAHKELETKKEQELEQSKEKIILKNSKSAEKEMAEQLEGLSRAQSLSLTSTSAPNSPR